MAIYEDLMRFKPGGLTPNAWAVRAGVSRTVWSDMRRHGNPSRRTLVKLLSAAGSSLAEFEALRVGDSLSGPGNSPVSAALGEHGRGGWRGAPLSPIPVYRCSVAEGEDGAGALLIDRSLSVSTLARPPSLGSDPNAFAITTIDEAMWPRFRNGRRLLVSPLATVQLGDDVLVTIERGGSDCDTAVIGELVRRSGTRIDLRQFNPLRTFPLIAADEGAIAKIVGEAY